MYQKRNSLINLVVVIFASGMLCQLAFAQTAGKNPKKVNKGKQTGKLQSMGAMLSEQQGVDTKKVPEPSPLGPMGGSPRPNPQPSQQVKQPENTPTFDSPDSPPKPSLPKLDEIIANARTQLKSQTIQDLVEYRREQSGIIYEPRTRFLPVALDRDQQWVNAFLTYSEFGSEQLQNQFLYNELLAMRRVRMRDWFQTRIGERVSGVENAESMKELAARIEEFSAQIWDVGTGLRETIDDWNEIQFEKSETDAVSIALATDATKSAFHPNWYSLASALPTDSVYIDIVRFQRLDNRNWQYCAFLISKTKRDTKVENDIVNVTKVDLGSAEKIDTAISRWVSAIKRGENDLVTGKSVFDQLWAPLQTRLLAVPHALYICADGAMASAPLAALPINEKQRLVDLTSVSFVPFAGYLVHDRLPLTERNWDLPPHPEFELMLVCPDNGPPYAKSEAEAIREFAIAKSMNTRFLTGETVNLQSVQEDLPKSSIAHFSSYGILAAQALSRNRQAELLPRAVLQTH